jgi:hypothetical protein
VCWTLTDARLAINARLAVLQRHTYGASCDIREQNYIGPPCRFPRMCTCVACPDLCRDAMRDAESACSALRRDWLVLHAPFATCGRIDSIRLERKMNVAQLTQRHADLCTRCSELHIRRQCTARGTTQARQHTHRVRPCSPTLTKT